MRPAKQSTSQKRVALSTAAFQLRRGRLFEVSVAPFRPEYHPQAQSSRSSLARPPFAIHPRRTRQRDLPRQNLRSAARSLFEAIGWRSKTKELAAHPVARAREAELLPRRSSTMSEADWE